MSVLTTSRQTFLIEIKRQVLSKDSPSHTIAETFIKGHPMPDAAPIVYIRGYAGTQGEVEQTVDDPTYGFNAGSTHIRLGQDGKADFYMFVSPFVRLFRDHGYQDVIDGAIQQLPPDIDPNRTIWIYRYYDPTSHTFDRPGGQRLSIEGAAAGLRDFILLRQQITQANTNRLPRLRTPPPPLLRLEECTSSPTLWEVSSRGA